MDAFEYGAVIGDRAAIQRQGPGIVNAAALIGIVAVAHLQGAEHHRLTRRDFNDPAISEQLDPVRQCRGVDGEAFVQHQLFAELDALAIETDAEGDGVSACRIQHSLVERTGACGQCVPDDEGVRMRGGAEGETGGEKLQRRKRNAMLHTGGEIGWGDFRDCPGACGVAAGGIKAEARLLMAWTLQ